MLKQRKMLPKLQQKRLLSTELPSAKSRIIYLRQRNIVMLKNDLIVRNPLNALGTQNDGIIAPGTFGAILSRAGVGKTSLLIQVALNALLRQKNILHVSLEDPVRKVNLWYKEVFYNLIEQFKVEQGDALWQEILPHRFIMTFNADNFSAARLQERVIELLDQDIFAPRLMLVDGLNFSALQREQLLAIHDLAVELELPVWFTVRTHRHEQENAADGIPVQLRDLDDLFSAIVKLQPQGQEIYLKVIKGCESSADQPVIQLDPATMLLKIDQ